MEYIALLNTNKYSEIENRSWQSDHHKVKLTEADTTSFT